jgi:cytochrome c
MQRIVPKRGLCGLAALFFGFGVVPSASALDEEGITALMKKSNCLKCHAVDKKKDGPSFQETAKKYKGKADGPEKVYIHLTTNPKVEIDGKKEEHDNLKTKNDADIKDVVKYILSR